MEHNDKLDLMAASLMAGKMATLPSDYFHFPNEQEYVDFYRVALKMTEKSPEIIKDLKRMDEIWKRREIKVEEWMEHSIKIEESYYKAVLSGDKNFEVRYNDRGYQKGDTVLLNEVTGFTGIRTGKFIPVKITYVTGFSQKENWVVFGFKKI